MKKRGEGGGKKMLQEEGGIGVREPIAKGGTLQSKREGKKEV